MVPLFKTSVTSTVNWDTPTAVGVPVIAPLGDNDNPAGSEPLEMLQIKTGKPPDTVSVWLYGLPAIPSGSDGGPIFSCGAADRAHAVTTAIAETR
jgi:hypothetical protein